MKISKEQQDIIEQIKEGNNVIVDAVAGSGKTTLVLQMALQCPEKNILQLTYNAMLKCEVRQKMQQYEIKNMEVHSYHSLAVKYYNKTAYTDDKLDKILKDNKPLCVGRPDFDILVIDESQDMTILYYELVYKFMRDIGKTLQMVVIGDKYQEIYQFKGSDMRYLTLAEEIWGRPFVRMNLSVSFRVSDNIRQFVNRCMLKFDRMDSCKKNKKKVDYLICNSFDIASEIGDNIIQSKYSPGDIFVLAPSIKSANCPCRCLENYLVMSGVPCFVPISESSKLDERVIEGKVVFSTIHQSKGRERPVVILYGFDNSYFNYFGKDLLKNTCPNTLYVAVTRASEKLILIHDNRQSQLEFLQFANTEEYLNIIEVDPLKKSIDGKVLRHNTSPTDLVKHIKNEYLGHFAERCKNIFKTIQQRGQTINIKSIIKTGPNSCEEVYDLNGIAIPWYEFKKRSDAGQQFLVDIMKGLTGKENTFVKRIDPNFNMNDILLLANIYEACFSGYLFKLQQIHTYDWLDENTGNKFCKRMRESLKEELDDLHQYEYHINIDNKAIKRFIETQGIMSQIGDVRFNGAAIDAMSGTTVYEFKCVTELQVEHYLQVVIYAWLWRLHGLPERRFVLFNLMDGEMKELQIESQMIDTIIKELLLCKFRKTQHKTDIQFILECDERVKRTKN